MSTIFHRPELAQETVRLLLRPTLTETIFEQGVFFSGPRRTGKSTFLQHDLIPALRAAGAIVIYIDLWSNVQASPDMLVREAIREALVASQARPRRLLGRLKRSGASAEFSALGLKFSFDPGKVGSREGPTLAHALAELVERAKTDVVLILDEVQQAIVTDAGQQMMLALKAARDAINLKPARKGRFLFVGTGSHRAMVGELTTRRNQAFLGAPSLPFPLLGKEYLSYRLKALSRESKVRLPSLEKALTAFQALGHRPVEFDKALLLLETTQRDGTATGTDPAQALALITASLRSGAADIEIAKIELMGTLALAIFDTVANAEDFARGLFSAESLARYAETIGRSVRKEEVQSVLNGLVDANLVMRRGHGLYGVADPFVREIWAERSRRVR